MGPEYLFRSVENRQHIGTHAPPKVPFMRARQIHVLARAYLVIFFPVGLLHQSNPTQYSVILITVQQDLGFCRL